MEEMQRLAGLAFAYGLVLGGALARLVGDPLLLVTGAIALGSFGGVAYGWLASRRASPWRDRRAPRAEAAANGALVGGVFGLIAAVIDALAGASMDVMLRAIAPAFFMSGLLGAALALAANGASLSGGVLIALYALVACGLGAWAAALGGRPRTGGDRRG